MHQPGKVSVLLYGREAGVLGEMVRLLGKYGWDADELAAKSVWDLDSVLRETRDDEDARLGLSVRESSSQTAAESLSAQQGASDDPAPVRCGLRHVRGIFCGNCTQTAPWYLQRDSDGAGILHTSQSTLTGATRGVSRRPKTKIPGF